MAPLTVSLFMFLMLNCKLTKNVASRLSITGTRYMTTQYITLDLLKKNIYLSNIC
jgi:hypothetical protein